MQWVVEVDIYLHHGLHFIYHPVAVFILSSYTKDDFKKVSWFTISLVMRFYNVKDSDILGANSESWFSHISQVKYTSEQKLFTFYCFFKIFITESQLILKLSELIDLCWSMQLSCPNNMYIFIYAKEYKFEFWVLCGPLRASTGTETDFKEPAIQRWETDFLIWIWSSES